MTAFWIWVLFVSPLAVGAIIGLMLMRRIRALRRDVDNRVVLFDLHLRLHEGLDAEVARLRRDVDSGLGLVGRVRDLESWCADMTREANERFGRDMIVRSRSLESMCATAERYSADIARLRALSQDLCDMLGHDERVLRVEEGHWDGNTWCCPATTYRCARCGAEWEIQDLLADKKERK